MSITISSADLRSIKAIEIAAGAGQWLKCQSLFGRKAYGVPSQSAAGDCYLTTQTGCTCPDAQWHEGMTCKHQFAVRLHVALVRTQRKGVKVAA